MGIRTRTGAVIATAALAVATGPSAIAAPAPIGFAPAQSFATGQTGTASLDNNGAAAADIDGDGHQDVALVAPWQGNKIVIAYGNGAGAFGAPQTLTVGSLNNDVILGDYNADGRTDLVATGQNTVVVLLNDGGHQFHQSATWTLSQTPFQASGLTQRIDGGATLDLVLKTVSGIKVYFGNGNGTFAAGPLTTIPFSFPGEIASVEDANLDGDGDVDLVAAVAGTQRVAALLGAGDGTFTVASQTFVPFVPTTAEPGDFDGDGLDDVAVLPEASPPNASAAVVINTGEGVLGQPTYYSGGFANPNGTTADFNGDGAVDVASVNTASGNVVVLAGVGDGTLAPAGTFGTAVNAQTPVAADFNEDGRPDLAVPTSCPGANGWYKVCLTLLRNQS